MMTSAWPDCAVEVGLVSGCAMAYTCRMILFRMVYV